MYIMKLMDRQVFLITLLLLLHFSVFAQQEKIPVFVAGSEGHKSYRIPALIRLPDGQLLAFAEGRVHGEDDFGDINIVLKRSKDGGKSWLPLEEVVDYDSLQAGNPAPVVDLSDPAYPKGRIFLFYNTGNNHEGEIRKGMGVREVWYKTSVDGGITWSDAINITTQVHRPNYPAANPAYAFKEDWRSYANTPGHALQFSKGKYKGRIYVAANHSEGPPKKGFADYFAHGFYTDDHGKTFHLGQSLSIPGSNEATAAELADGGLILNARNQRGDVKARIVAISKDGGATWDQTYFDRQLPDPVCQGSILNIGWKKKQAILAFTNVADTLIRDRLTLRISEDEGKTWKIKQVVAVSDARKDSYAAYSDIVLLKNNKIGILYEADVYTKILFTVY
jgi:sialidase-1